MRQRRVLPSLVAVFALAAVACGDDDESASTPNPTTTTTDSTTLPSTTITPGGLEQPAIWPAADVVFATPEEAATDFVETALGVPAVIGEFMQGDSRSGEIEVFFEADGQPRMDVPRSLITVRQLGPEMGWFVTSAWSDGATIDSPSSGASTAAGALDVAGDARGFERTIIVRAFPAGDATVIDNELATGGGNETPEPYMATLDLSTAVAGQVLVILVRGDSGLETDPGEFSAIALVIG